MNTTAVRVDFYYDHDCPLAEDLRRDLLTCLAERHIRWEWIDHIDEGRLSPTVLLDGIDLVDPVPPGHGCRLARPDRERICEELTRFEAA